MIIRDLINILSLGNHELYPTATNDDVIITSKAIGYEFPQSYKTFVTEFSNGAYLYMVQEICCVGDCTKKIQSIQDAYEPHKKSSQLLNVYESQVKYEISNLIPYSLDSNGNAWCFVKHSNKVCYLELTENRLFGFLNGFEEWLGILVKSKNEVIREIYDEEFLFKVLNLG